MLYRIIAVLTLLAAVVTATALHATAPEQQVVANERAARPVEVQAILPQHIDLEVQAQGSVMPAVETRLIAEVAGRIVETAPTLVVGGAFNEGEVLLKLDDTQLKAQLTQAEARHKRASAELRHARYEQERAAKLAEQHLTSRAGLENATRVRRVAEANLQDAAAGLEQARRDLERTKIRAPYNGRVRSESVDVGQFLQRGADIATLYADDAVEVRLPIKDAELAFLDIPLNIHGHIPAAQRPAVTLSAEFGGQELTWQGQVVRRDAQIDGFSRMVHLIARVPRDAGEMPLPVGLFVEARIQGISMDDAIVLPRAALREDDQVLVVDTEDRLRFRRVDAVRLDSNRVLVREGLSAGERVCISPVATPVDGMFVAPLIAG